MHATKYLSDTLATPQQKQEPVSKQIKKQPKQKKEIRSTIQGSKLEAREAQDGSKKLKGYAVVFNSPADIGDFTEIVAPGSFTQTLREDDQVMLRDHQSELLLGRRSAKTLILTQDEIGVAFELAVPNTSLGQDTYENVRLGNLKGCSFGFIVRDSDWQQDRDGKLTRVIKNVQCFETTLTAFPAYPATSVDTRSVRSKLKLKRDDDDDELDVCNEDSPDYDPDACQAWKDDDDGDDEEECECECQQCGDDRCEKCSNVNCQDENCLACANQERAAHMALLMRRLR